MPSNYKDNCHLYYSVTIQKNTTLFLLSHHCHIKDIYTFLVYTYLLPRYTIEILTFPAITIIYCSMMYKTIYMHKARAVGYKKLYLPSGLTNKLNRDALSFINSSTFKKVVVFFPPSQTYRYLMLTFSNVKSPSDGLTVHSS